MKPLLTIITVVFNNANYVSDAIDSVLRIKTEDVQYIIIDGASTDGTIDIIKSYGNRISKLISESDDGLYYAMNKGAEMADGDYISFINADDYYVDRNVEEVIAKLREKKPDVLYADLDYIDTNKFVKRRWRPGIFKAKNLESLWIPPHPTTFMKLEIFKKAGGFNISYNLAADYDLILRALLIAKNVYYLDTVLVKMRLGGATNISWSNIYKQNIEIAKSYKSIFNRYPIRQFVLKAFSRLTQMIRKKI